MQIELGKPITVKKQITQSGNKKKDLLVSGKVVQVTDKLVVLDVGLYREAFNRGDVVGY